MKAAVKAASHFSSSGPSMPAKVWQMRRRSVCDVKQRRQAQAEGLDTVSTTRAHSTVPAAAGKAITEGLRLTRSWRPL